MPASSVDYNKKRTVVEEQDLICSIQWLYLVVTRVENEHLLRRQCLFIIGCSRAMQSWLTALPTIFVDVF